MNNVSLESKGQEILKDWLTGQGRRFKQSDIKTFDLIVDGEYAEVKAKAHGWEGFDFLSLTSNQQSALGQQLKRIFLVLNVENPDEAEVVEIRGEDLLKCKSNKIVHHEWNKGQIQHLRPPKVAPPDRASRDG